MGIWDFLARKKHYEPWLIIDVTTECNLRCKHCHLWMTKEPLGSLQSWEKERVIDQFGKWKRQGKVILAGGETFLKKEEVFRLSQKAKGYGLHSIVLSNSTLFDEEIIDSILTSGISQLSISLDGHTADYYDYSRGVPGTFNKAIYWLRKLSEEKKKRGYGPGIYVNTMLKRSFLPILKEHFAFVRSLGVDGIFVFPIEHTFANQQQVDPYYEKEKLLPDEHFLSAIDWLLSLKKANDFFFTNAEEDLLLVRDLVLGKDRWDGQICVAGEKNIIVDLMGNVRFCHLMEEHISSGKTLGNIRDADLRSLCESSEARLYRKKMSSCREPCELLSCNRRTSV